MMSKSKALSRMIYMTVADFHCKWGEAFGHKLNNNIIDDLRAPLSQFAREWYYCEIEKKGHLVPRELRNKTNLFDDVGHRKFRGKFTYTKCEICEAEAPIAAAHILPRAAGGDDSDNNLIHLCENHHYLYDRGLLTKEEFAKIEYESKSPKAKWWINNVIVPNLNN